MKNSMKKELNRTVNLLLSELRDGLIGAKNFAKRELPLVAKEIVKMEGLLLPAYYLIAASIFLPVDILLTRYAYFHMDGGDQTMSEVFGTVFGAIAVITIIVNIGIILKASMAPRLFIIEYLKNLVEEPRNEK